MVEPASTPEFPEQPKLDTASGLHNPLPERLWTPEELVAECRTIVERWGLSADVEFDRGELARRALTRMELAEHKDEDSFERTLANVRKSCGKLEELSITVTVDIAQIELPYELRARIGDELRYDLFLIQDHDAKCMREIAFHDSRAAFAVGFTKVKELIDFFSAYLFGQVRMLVAFGENEEDSLSDN